METEEQKNSPAAQQCDEANRREPQARVFDDPRQLVWRVWLKHDSILNVHVAGEILRYTVETVSPNKMVLDKVAFYSMEQAINWVWPNTTLEKKVLNLSFASKAVLDRLREMGVGL